MLRYITNIADILSSKDINIPKTEPTTALPNLLKIVFAVAGAVSVLIITIAGLRMVLSQGNPESVNRARNTVIYAAIGLMVCVFGFAIVTFVLNKI